MRKYGRVCGLFRFTLLCIAALLPDRGYTDEIALKNGDRLTGGWLLKLFNILEHDGDPPEGVERSDWHRILGLLYSFYRAGAAQEIQSFTEPVHGMRR